MWEMLKAVEAHAPSSRYEDDAVSSLHDDVDWDIINMIIQYCIVVGAFPLGAR